MPKINAAGVKLIKDSEGFLAHPYPDPASPLGLAARSQPWGRKPAALILSSLHPDTAALSGHPWTQGYGFTRGITANSPEMSADEADQRFVEEVCEYANSVEACLKVRPNENQLAAMTSLAWNIGITNFRKSSVCRAHNTGKTDAAARAFSLWNKAGGQVLRGLVVRRAAEAALYLKPAFTAELPPPEVPAIERRHVPMPDIDPMPQIVDPEPKLTSSNIMRASGVSGGVAGLTLAAEGARAVGEIRYSLGEWLPYIALGVVVIAAGWTIWERLKQRREGFK